MVIGVIPARLDSKRFPKKILADIGGKPMVIRVAEQAAKAKKLDKIIIAIDAKETKQALSEYNFDLILTSKKHATGTERVGEVAKKELDAEIIINIQGDEPLLSPKLIDQLVDVVNTPNVMVATIVSRKLTVTDLLDPNVVKAILDENQNTKDFKRNVFDMEIGAVYRHIGMYGFKRNALFLLNSLNPSEREQKKSLEQFRALDHGVSIKALITDCEQIAVDTPEDLSKVLEIMNMDLNNKYKMDQ
ncbi:MAG: 3-deoxy-manno-octulosonate cytidylyltransferase [Candidatus Marinimicrobia bacterium]|nr:3-deoxy-manno-octulosonate cytidylyltransferase [Candidatus Neomarinimicrobiota bacterium]|tara:strand:+ start:22578 stop:23315 length:738 start_codon:yes stop_codon:yes gene_type:complete